MKRIVRTMMTWRNYFQHKIHRINIFKTLNHFQFLGKWYEVERSFYLPEIASGCTTLTFEDTTIRDSDGRPQLEIAIKTVNRW